MYVNIYVSSACIQQYPDYYAIIKEPIDFRTIAQRIQVCVSPDHNHCMYVKQNLTKNVQ